MYIKARVSTIYHINSRRNVASFFSVNLGGWSRSEFVNAERGVAREASLRDVHFSLSFFFLLLSPIY